MYLQFLHRCVALFPWLAPGCNLNWVRMFSFSLIVSLIRPAGQHSMISFWVHAIAYRTVVWFVFIFICRETYIANTSSRSARLSILLSILPFTSTSHNLRRLTIFIAGLFVLMWLSFIISFVAICVSSHGVCAAPSQRYEQETRLLTIFELFGMFFFVVFG